MSDRRGIETVGLGQFAGGSGEIADLAWIDHRQGQMSRRDRAGDDRFIAAGRLHHDQAGSERAQSLHQNRQPFTVARDGEALSARPNVHVQPILRHIDADKVLHVPSLRMRARLTAPATVRADRTGGWGAVLRNGLFDPRSQRAPIRHRNIDSNPILR